MLTENARFGPVDKQKKTISPTSHLHFNLFICHWSWSSTSRRLFDLSLIQLTLLCSKIYSYRNCAKDCSKTPDSSYSVIRRPQNEEVPTNHVSEPLSFFCRPFLLTLCLLHEYIFLNWCFKVRFCCVHMIEMRTPNDILCHVKCNVNRTSE